MEVKKFELWLDESGNFVEENNLRKNPSLVGGVLIEKDALSISDVLEIIGAKYIHSNEMKNENFGKYATDVLSNLIEKNGQIVVFENEERLQIVNGTLTYLNIISEGIIQLLQSLSAEYENIELDILVAVRLDMERQNIKAGQIIRYDEYISRLEEKIIIGLARRLISSNKRWKWNIKLGSAREDQRLMLADVVCNSWLTRTSRKFDLQQKELLEELYKKYKFTVFEKSTPMYIKSLIVDGKLSDAAFEVYMTDENLDRYNFIDIIIKRLQILGSNSITGELLNLKNKIDILVRSHINFARSKTILLKIQDDFIFKMKESGMNPGIFTLDINLYLLTIYTHEGNIADAEKQILICEEALKNLANRWESVDYFFMFKIRQAIHKINCFDFHNASNDMSTIVNSLKDTMDLFSIIEGLDKLYSNIKSDLLGKALGTRLQANSFSIRREPKVYEEAKDDSDKALSEFMSKSDISRQYQYRALVECENGDYKLALKYLFKAAGIEKTGDHLEKSIALFLDFIKDASYAELSFYEMHYTRIMSEAASRGDLEFASVMHNLLEKKAELYNKIIKTEEKEHPYEIILWKIATFHGLKGNIAAAITLYDKAINICFCRPERWTIIAIGLGIMAEKAAILSLNSEKYSKEANKSIKEFSNKYVQFNNLNLPSSMREYFKGWNQEISIIQETNNRKLKYELLWNLSREITY